MLNHVGLEFINELISSQLACCTAAACLPLNAMTHARCALNGTCEVVFLNDRPHCNINVSDVADR